MEIIKQEAKVASGDVDKAIIDLVEGEFKKEKNLESKRIHNVQSEIQHLKGATSAALGKCVASMPVRDYFRLINKYGVNHVHSKEFLKYFNKKTPELSPNRI